MGADEPERGPRAGRPPSAPADDRLQELAGELSELCFHLVTQDRSSLLARRERVSRLLHGLHARMEHPDAPLLVVVGGGSGAGKSTTVNTLAGAQVTMPGVLRPTTRVPTLVCHPDDLAWFERDRVLPDLVRVPADAPEPDDSGRHLRLATSDRLPAGVALLDTPDIDSVELGNHTLADQALDAADAWIWLATVRTYADQIGMDYLLRARSRHARTAVAITQARAGQQAELEPDVERLLADAEVTVDVQVFIPFAEVVDGQLPPHAVAGLRHWLDELASEPADRSEVRERAVHGLRATVPDELAPLLAAAEAEVRAARGLDALVATRFDAVVDGLERDLETGLPLRSEVVNRWQQLVGGNETLLRVQTAAGRLGDLVRSRLNMPSPDHADEVRVEVANELTNSITLLVEQAHREVRRGLEERPEGRALLDHLPGLRHAPPDQRGVVRAVVAGWEEHVSTSIDEIGAPGKARAKRLSTGLNAVATSAILVLFALSGGLTGGEVGIAAGAAAANQWLLTRLFGEHNVRRVLAEINADLFTRVEELTAAERLRYTSAIAQAQPPASVVGGLRAVVDPRR